MGAISPHSAEGICGIFFYMKFYTGGKVMDVNEVILRGNKPRREPMDFERFKFICYFIAGMTAMVLGFVAVYMVIYFAGR